MSQNVLRTKGSSRGPTTASTAPSKMTSADLKKHHQSNNNNNLTNNKSNKQNNTNLDENHNTKHVEKENQTATTEQIRLAQLMGNKSEDPELIKKIKQIAEFVPFKQTDEIIIALHEFDYDLNRTIDFLLEGGDLTQDWVTAGKSNKSSKQQSSPNQTLDFDNHNNHHMSPSDLNAANGKNSFKKSSNKNKREDLNGKGSSTNRNTRGNNHGGSNLTNGTLRQSKRHPNSRDANTNNTDNMPNENLDENMMMLDIQDNGNGDGQRFERRSKASAHNNSNNNNSADLTSYPNDQQEQHQYGGAGRASKRNGTNARTNATGGNATGRNPGVYRNGGGARIGNNGAQRSTGAPRINNEGDSKTAVDGGGVQYNNKSNSEILKTNEPNEIVLSNVVAGDPSQTATITAAVAPLPTTAAANGVPLTSAAAIVAGTATTTGRNSDNMRDIGTWSNEQAAAEKAKLANRQQHALNRQKNSAPNGRGGKNVENQQELLDNEEEWQGDLSQSQIFTSSSQQQQKKAEGPNGEVNKSFPIGHFNAEEATQKIKRAVGIGNVNTTTNTTITNKQASSNTNQHQHTTKNNLNKFGSIKVPPPSTKIPKSAVVMPDTGNNSSNFNLDVQFGVDFDNHHLTASSSSSNTTAKAITPTASTTGAKTSSSKTTVSSTDKTKQPPKETSQSKSSVQMPPVSKPTSAVLNNNTNTSSSSINLSNVPTPSQPVQAPKLPHQLGQQNKSIGKPVSVSVNPTSAFSATDKGLQQMAPGTNLGANNLSNAAVKLINADTSIVNVVNSSNNNNNNNNNQTSSSNSNVNNNSHQQQLSSSTNLSNLAANSSAAQKQSQHSLDNASSKLASNTSSNQKTASSSSSSGVNQKPTGTSSSFGMMNQLGNNNNNNNQHSDSSMHQPQSQQQQQYHYQQQGGFQHQHSNIKDSSSNQSLSAISTGTGSIGGMGSSAQQHMLNISPPNAKSLMQQSSQSMQQIQQLQQMNGVNNSSNSINPSSSSSSNNNISNNNSLSSNSSKQQQMAAANAASTMPPPPGVNLVNPGVNNQFLMGLPFQNFPYFDHSQLDGNSFVQMYNHLAGVPPGVGASLGGNTPQLPYGPNYYPNMFIQSNPQAFQSNKPPYGANFNNNNSGGGNSGNNGNGAYDQDPQGKDYCNYGQQQQQQQQQQQPPQSQMKSSASNLSNVSELAGVGAYQKNNMDKSGNVGGNGGYHTPPPNYTNSLMNQPHPNVNQSNVQLPHNQYTYIASMMGGSGSNPNPLVNAHGGIQQENMNSRGGIGNQAVSKPISKTNYSQNSWN